MIRRPPRSTLSSSSAASDVYKRQLLDIHGIFPLTRHDIVVVGKFGANEKRDNLRITRRKQTLVFGNNTMNVTRWLERFENLCRNNCPQRFTLEVELNISEAP